MSPQSNTSYGVFRTRKSTPIVALLSSSGTHCSSENRRRRQDFPTDIFPIRRSFTFVVEGGGDMLVIGIGAR